MSIRPFAQISPSLHPSSYVDLSAVVIGDVHLDENVSLWPMCVIRGDVNFIRIGARSNIQDGAIIHVTHKGEFNKTGNSTTIGSDVTIGHQAVIHGCDIGNLVLVGIGSQVLDGAVLEDNVMIGAGSLVPPGKHLTSGFLYFGAPVKKIRPLTQKELQFLAYSASHYVQLKNRYQVHESPGK